jgi:hypothetical protein
MGLWKEYFHWSVLLGWDFLGWIIAAFLAVGGLVLFFDQYVAANACFMLTTIFIFAKITQLSVQSNSSTVDRFLFTFVLFGVFGIGIVETFRGVNHWAQSKLEPKPDSSKESAKLPLTLPARPPIPHLERSPMLPPEVVLTADQDITYVLIWIPGTKTSPTVQPAGKSGYPAMELKNLSGSPVTGVSIDWSVIGPPIENVIRSSEHFRKYNPMADHGMYRMDNGEGVGIPVEDHDHSDIPYVADSAVPIDIPGGIWHNFFLRMVATVERPVDNSSQPPLKTTQPVATAVLKYHQSNQTYTRTFQIKAVLFVIPNSALIGALGDVDIAHRSPDNLRAQMRFSISESFRR